MTPDVSRNMLLYLVLLTASEVLGRGLTIEPSTSFTTHVYTSQVDITFTNIVCAYPQLAAVGDPLSQFRGDEPPWRQHKLPLQLADLMDCPVLLPLVNDVLYQ